MSQPEYLQANLIRKCKQQNAKAQLKLYDTYCQAMYTTAFNYVKQEAVAEDMMQEAFIKAFQKIDNFDGKVTFGAWLKKIVINQCLDWLKKRKLRIVSLENEHVKITEEDDWAVEDTITVPQIYKAIEQLPDKYKIAVKLFLLEGYDHQEISQILNITEVSSRTQIFRGKNKLRELLKQYNYA
ncbi:MAG TPA: RNA polymerase sigma factor [Flavobacteriia bacterium]|jgi:RNA polymerase sigma-70 factor (ECF subfamily)|nr:RNA polymerase sigma factor [Flavobacteriia bacterium]